MTTASRTTAPDRSTVLDSGARDEVRQQVLAAMVHGPRPPRRPAARLVGACVVAAVTLAGTWLPGRLSADLPDGWDHDTIVVTDTGARYVALDGILYPVANAVSARLLVPPSPGRFIQVSDRQLDTAPRGTEIGITGAPDSLPSTGGLSDTGWTACLTDQARPQVRLAAGTGTGAPPTGSTAAVPPALLVRSGGGLSVLTGGSRLDIPAAQAPAVLRALGWQQVTPVDVPTAWLALFSQGADLVPLRLPQLAGPAGPRLPPAARIGSLLVTGPAATARTYLVTGADQLVLLTPLTARLYQLGSPAAALDVTAADIATVPTAADPATPAGWPDAVPVPDPTARCAVLGRGADGAAATVAVQSPPAGDAPTGTVPVGAGALVRSAGAGPAASSDDPGRVFLVDATATAYPLAADSLTLVRLGYQQSDVRDVPAAWLALLPRGPTLGVAQAASPVS